MLQLISATAMVASAVPQQVPNTKMMKLTYFVKQQPDRVQRILDELEEVSDPRSPRYGRHLSHADVQQLQRPLPAHVDAVREHINAVGGMVMGASLAEDKIIARVPLPATSTIYDFLGKQGEGSLWEAVDTVAGFPRSTPKSKKQGARPAAKGSRSKVVKSDDPQACLANQVDPVCLRKAYGIESEVSTAKNNSQAVIVNQGYQLSDLTSFCSSYNLQNCPTTITDVGTNDGEAGDEASLDIQYTVAMGQGVPETWVYIDGTVNNPFASWIMWASNNTNVPWVQSLSVGEPEDQFASDNGGDGVLVRMNAEMAAMGLRGISIIFASGDSGYTPAQNYPSSSPYVTSMGGVWYGPLGESPLQVDPITTGGFSSSSANPIAKWQVDAVKSWQGTSGDRPSSYNASNRCCPDLAIVDADVQIVQGGSPTAIGGTSAAAPIFAGMISSINGHLLNAKKSTMGFLNPFLYKNKAAFTDITLGDNGGFAATTGYDPASGLGTFSPTTFAQLKTAALGGGEHGTDGL